MDNRPIGVFDSGLGGLSAVRRLQEFLPHEDIVYFGDTGRVPYGTRSEDTIRRYASEDCQFLLSKDVKFIIAACGTVSSVAADVLNTLPVPAIGVVDATAAAAASATQTGRIGILGTTATIRSAAFERALLAADPQVSVTAVPCPLFVPLVESGWLSPDDDVAKPMVRRYLHSIKEADVDTLILGCTHFPLLAPIIQAELGDGVRLIDSGEETARRCAALLSEENRHTPERSGRCEFFVSDQPGGFSQVAEIFLGHPVSQEVTMVPPDCLVQRG